MNHKNSRLIIEINNSVEYSHIEKNEQISGVSSLDKIKLKHVEDKLKKALLHVGRLLSHK